MNNNNSPSYTAFTVTISPSVINTMGSKTLIKQSFKKLKHLLKTYIKECVCTMEFTKKGTPHFHGWYCDEDIDESQFHLLIHSITYKNKGAFFGFILLKPADDLKGWEEYIFKSAPSVTHILKKLKIDMETSFTHKRKTPVDLFNIKHQGLDETEIILKELSFD